MKKTIGFILGILILLPIAYAETPQPAKKASVMVEDGIDDYGDAVKVDKVIQSKEKQNVEEPNPNLPTVPKL